MRYRLIALRARIVAAPLESWITAAVVVGAVAFTFAQLHPHLIFRNTTPTGGDMGAHVWSGTYLRDHLLPHGRLSGWTPDWYAGAPAFHFYMVVPFLLILVLDVVLPYAVAFKIVAVSGVVLLPVAAWAFGKLSGLRFPGPPMLAAVSVFFLFDTSFTIYGGNIASTMAGEFAFAISLSLSLVYLAVVARGLQTGKHRALAAVLLALVGLCHLIPAFFAIVGTLVMLALHARRTSVRWVLTVAPVAALLGAFWALPFVWRRDYMNDMGWEKIQPWSSYGLWTTDWWARVGDSLWPWDNRLAWLLALIGVAGGIAGRKRPHLFLTIMTVLAGVAFVLLPQSRLWNARLLPFYYLGTYLLAALGVVEIARALSARFAADRPATRRTVLRVVPVVGILLTLVWVGMGLRTLPFGRTDRANEYHWMGLTSRDDNFVDGWARWNFTGYEGRKPTVDGGGYHEYRDLIETMKTVGAEEGCGRAMWEYEPELVRYGTPMALMLLPHWTDGCIGSMEGLYFESSATTPFHFLNRSELSAVPSRAQRDLPYGPLDVRRGVEHLQLMGVRYYLTTSETARAQAAAVDELTEVASSGPWTVFEVASSELVAPLANQPAVLTDVGQGQNEWLEPAVDWYLDAGAHDVFLAADGPPEWPRIEAGEDPPAVRVEPVEVTNIEAGDDRISFDVDQVGQPVLVRASYFPNWDASGAEGPYRVAPNLMVVVPTDTHVELHYGWTPVDLLAWFLTFLGIGGVVLLARRPDLDVPAPPQPVVTSVYGDDPPEVRDGDPDSGLDEGRPEDGDETAGAEEDPSVPHEVPVGRGGLMRRFGPGVSVVLATAVDVGGLLALRAATGWPIAVADAVALAVAAPVSYGLHRATDRGADPFVRWVRDPARFARVALVAGLVDVAVLQILVVVVGDPALPTLFGLKLLAVTVAALVRIVGHRRILLRAVQADQAEPAARPPAPGDRRVTVVLPSYHQADEVGEAVRRVRQALTPVLGIDDVEIIVVDDGSGDDTAARAEAAGADRVVVHPVNRGKGAAVRSGAAVARGRTITFTDTDLAYDPAQLLVLLERVEAGWDVAVGSRRHTDAVTLVRARRFREVGGRVINLLTQAVLLGNYRDTQCGLKGFRSDVAPVILGQGLIDGFAFDIELFHLVERNGLTLTEVPVQVANSERSSVQVVRDGVRLVRDLFRIRRNAAAGRYTFDPALPDPVPEGPGSVG